MRIERPRSGLFDASHIQHRVCKVPEPASHPRFPLCKSPFAGEVSVVFSSHSSIQDDTFEQYASFLRFVKDSPLPTLLYLYLFVLCRVVCLLGISDVGHRPCSHHARGARGVASNLLFRPLHVRDLLPLYHGEGGHRARAVGSPHPIGRSGISFLSLSFLEVCRSRPVVSSSRFRSSVALREGDHRRGGICVISPEVLRVRLFRRLLP